MQLTNIEYHWTKFEKLSELKNRNKCSSINSDKGASINCLKSSVG